MVAVIKLLIKREYLNAKLQLDLTANRPPPSLFSKTTLHMTKSNIYYQTASEYDQEIPQSHTKD